MTEVETVPSLLLPCIVCGRTFLPEALAKHSVVCERSHAKKRKKFDSAKQRIQGTELAEFLGPPPLATKAAKPKPPSPKKVQSRWKEKHEHLLRSVREEAPSLVRPIDHQQCTYCERSFGPKAFDRHVAWCKEQHYKIQLQHEDVSKAKQKLNARTKYRAPSFRSQRSLTKEKYSPHRPVANSSTLQEKHQPPSPANEKLPQNFSNKSDSNSYSVNTSANKSPALSRENSVRVARKDTPSPKNCRISRANSVSSHASDTKSVSSGHSTFEMDSSPYKPTIKTSSISSTSLNRRWSPTGGAGGDQNISGISGTDDPSGLGKFCHECGGRYPVPGAKFCCLCGVRRLAI